MIMSGTSRRDHFRDLRVAWACHDMDTLERRRGLHPSEPRYFDEVWYFLPRHAQSYGVDCQLDIRAQLAQPGHPEVRDLPQLRQLGSA